MADMGAKGSTAEPLRFALGPDLIWGVKAIAAEINRNARQTFHLLEIGQLPAKKFGGRWVASRARLREHFGALLDAERSGKR